MRTAALLILAVTGWAPSVGAEAPPPPPPSASTPVLAPDAHPEPRPLLLRNATAVQLFAAVEESWGTGDAETLAALVDTTQVRIGIKPGSTPTVAMTRSAAAFLFQDQLRLVATQSFQVFRVNVGSKSASATARWWGDWGGRQGVRRLTVTLSAAPIGGRWCLREVRVKG